MIGTITLNPCLDKTLTIDGFTFGGMNRVQEKRVDAGGKGINVSAVLAQNGQAVRTFGLHYENGSELLLACLQEIGIDYEGFPAAGTLRENVKLYDKETNLTTEFNQKGDFVGTETLEAFTEYLERAMDELDILVVTGSVPQGVPVTYYRELIEKANAKGIKCILDAEGPLLLEGMKAKPYLIKPNLFEFDTAFGLKSHELPEIIAVCRKLIAEGVEVVCLSMGEAGALIVDRERAYRCRPTEMKVKSTQGAGDSLVAGICMALEKGLSLPEMLKYGVCAAQGSLIREGTLLCTKEDFEQFKAVVIVETLE